MKKIIGLFLLALTCISCNKKDAGEVVAKESGAEKVSAKVFGSYIVFYLDGPYSVQVYQYKNHKDVSKYSAPDLLFESSVLDEGRFVEVDGNYLIYDYGTSPNPHLIRIFDLKKKEDLLYGKYYFPFGNYKAGGKYRVLLTLGKKLDEEQTKKLDKTSLENAIKTQKEYNSEYGGIGYYEEYLFDPGTKELKSLDKIIAVLLQ